MKLELTHINNETLNQTIKDLAAKERQLTEEILWHIAEVDRRKLFLRMAYSSLYDYLTKEIGYTAGSAQRRIDAARLIQKLPEVSSKIKSGALNLGQISKVQKIQRQVKKESGKTVTIVEQKDLLKNLENKSLAQTDLIIAQHFNVEVKTQEKKQIQKDESVRIELTFSKEEMALIKKAQQLLSNKTGGSLKDTLLAMANKTIKSATSKKNKIVSSNQSTATIEVKNLASKNNGIHAMPVSLKTKRLILNRDECCQFKDPISGNICGSQFFLEVDHITPRFAKGSNATDNLRILCRNHNQFRYQAKL